MSFHQARSPFFKNNLAVPSSFPLVGTLVDNFNLNVLDTSLWSNFGGSSVVNTNRRLEMTTDVGGSEIGLDSIGNFSLQNSSISVELVNAGNQSLTSLTVFPITTSSGSNYPYWVVENGNIHAGHYEGSNTDVYTATYNSTTHRFLRMRESAGTVYFDYSPDGVVWTNGGSYATPSYLLNFQFEMLVVSSAEATPTTVIIDNVNFQVNQNATVSDSIATTEAIKVELNSFINKSDSITLTESVLRTLINNVTVNDTVATTEANNRLLESNRAVSDTITITESVTMLIPTLLLSVTDTITTTEAFAGLLTSNALSSEGVTLTESIQMFTNILYNAVSDNTTVSESVNLALVHQIQVTDTIATAELVTMAGAQPLLAISTSDTIATSEACTLSLDASVVASDAIALTESVTKVLEANISTSDSAAVSESIRGTLLIEIDAFDIVLLDESKKLLIPVLFLTTSDTINTTDTANAAKVHYLSVSDSIGVSDVMIGAEFIDILLVYPRFIFVDGALAFNLTGTQYTRI